MIAMSTNAMKSSPKGKSTASRKAKSHNAKSQNAKSQNAKSHNAKSHNAKSNHDSPHNGASGAVAAGAVASSAAPYGSWEKSSSALPQAQLSWSFDAPFDVAALPAEGMSFELVADAALREEFARLNNLVALFALTLSCTLKPMPSGRVRLTGMLHADVEQACVVSLEAFPARVEEPIALEFARADAGALGHFSQEDWDMTHFVKTKTGAGPHYPSAFDGAHGPDGDMSGDDAPEPLQDGKIDFAALASEFLILGLDLYPRKPGAEFAPKIFGEDEPVTGKTVGTPSSPFAVLADFRQKQQ